MKQQQARAATIAADEDRRRALRGIAAALAASLAGAPGTSFAGLFGRTPRELPAGRSIYELRGDVRVNGHGATLETPINAGDVLETGRDGYVAAVVGRDALLLRGNSRLELDLGRAARQFFRLVSGAMLAVYDPRRGEDRIELSTPVVTLGIRGTGVYVETDAVRTYVCTCYGTVDIATVGGTPQRERVVTTHHDAPRWVLAQAQDGQRILPAPVMMNHDDAELILLEALVGRAVPFNAGDYDERPRREY